MTPSLPVPGIATLETQDEEYVSKQRSGLVSAWVDPPPLTQPDFSRDSTVKCPWGAAQPADTVKYAAQAWLQPSIVAPRWCCILPSSSNFSECYIKG
jgi:hypothetical protein